MKKKYKLKTNSWLTAYAGSESIFRKIKEETHYTTINYLMYKGISYPDGRYFPTEVSICWWQNLDTKEIIKCYRNSVFESHLVQIN